MKERLNYKILNILCYLSIFLIPGYFFRIQILGFKTNVFEIILLLTFLLLIMDYSFDLTIKKFSWGNLWIYLFLLAGFLGVIISGDKTHAAGILKGWIIFPIILYILIVNYFDKKSLPKISVFIYISLTVISLWALMQKIGLVSTLFYQVGDKGFDQYLGPNFRTFGPFESPNYLAMYLVPAVFMALPLIGPLRSKLLKILIASSFLLPLLALYFSTSRGGAVALASSILAFLLFLYFKSKTFKKSFESLSNILILGLILVSTIFLIYAVRIISPNQGGDSIRLEIYNYSLQLLKDNSILGIGLGSFQEKIALISIQRPSFQQFGLSYALHPHNLYLALWFNLGLLGLVSFCALVLIAVKDLFTSQKELFQRSCIFAGLIAVLVHGFFDTTYFKNDLSAIFWLLLAMSFILHNNAIEKKY